MAPLLAQAEAGAVLEMVHEELTPFSFERALQLQRLVAWPQAHDRRVPGACASQP